MLEQRCDVAVVGLGAMGAATLYQLAKAGANVVGIDRYVPPHDQGSSHGDTRITRLAVGEGVGHRGCLRQKGADRRALTLKRRNELPG